MHFLLYATSCLIRVHYIILVFALRCLFKLYGKAFNSDEMQFLGKVIASIRTTEIGKFCHLSFSSRHYYSEYIILN